MISCNYNLPQGNCGQIERISLTSESVDDKNIEKQLNWDFFKDFLIANKPCIININSIVQQWSAVQHWVKINGDINFEYLLQQYGMISIFMYVCIVKFQYSIKYSGCRSVGDTN